MGRATRNFTKRGFQFRDAMSSAISSSFQCGNPQGVSPAAGFSRTLNRFTETTPRRIFTRSQALSQHSRLTAASKPPVSKKRANQGKPTTKDYHEIADTIVVANHELVPTPAHPPPRRKQKLNSDAWKATEYTSADIKSDPFRQDSSSAAPMLSSGPNPARIVSNTKPEKSSEPAAGEETGSRNCSTIICPGGNVNRILGTTDCLASPISPGNLTDCDVAQSRKASEESTRIPPSSPAGPPSPLLNSSASLSAKASPSITFPPIPKVCRIPFSPPYILHDQDPDHIFRIVYDGLIGEPEPAHEPRTYAGGRTHDELRHMYNNHGPDVINEWDEKEGWLFEAWWVRKYLLKPLDSGRGRIIWPYWLGPNGELFSLEDEGVVGWSGWVRTLKVE